MGPKKDIVGLFKQATQKHGIKFAVSEHLAPSYHWLQVSHRADKNGAMAGVPYDGIDSADWDLYHETHDVPRNAKGEEDLWSPMNVPTAWKRRYFDRIKDLIDNYEPDLLYTDGPIFFEEYGLSVVAHHYNKSAKKNGGTPQTVYTSKRREDSVVGTCVLDLERGVVDKIWPDPWQTDTCIGQWHYNKGEKYKSAKLVIDMLVDIVSRNGNLMLNFPLNSKGELDSEELKVLDSVTKWMAVNSEGIYGNASLEDLRRRPGHVGLGARRRGALQREQAQRFLRRRRAFHQEGQYALRVFNGRAGAGSRVRAAWYKESSGARQGPARGASGLSRTPQVQTGRDGTAH